MTFKAKRILTPNGGYSPGQIQYKGKFRKTLAINIIERTMIGNAHFVHVLSEKEERDVKLIAPKAKTVIAPNGFDIEIVESFENRKEQQNEIKNILFVGRLAIMHKGLDLLAKSFSKVSDSIKWKIELAGPYKQTVKQYLEDFFIQTNSIEKFSILGPIYGEKKIELLQNADCFIHTSRYEGMPFSVIEAMAYGLPVIITSGTNLVDLVTQYDAGWVVSDQVDTEEIEKILNTDIKEYRIKGANAQRLVKEKLNWDSIGDTLFSDLKI